MYGLPDAQFYTLYNHWEQQIYELKGMQYESIIKKYPDWEDFILNGGIFRLDKISNRKSKGRSYFTTFTLNPNQDKEKLKYLVTEILPYRPTLGIIEFHYTEEHKDSNYHIHCLYKSTKTISKSRMHNYEKYGFIDHQKCKSWEEVFTYINKENPSVKIK